MVKVKVWTKTGAHIGKLIKESKRAEVLPQSCNGKNDNDVYVTILKANNYIHIPKANLIGIEKIWQKEKENEIKKRISG